MKIKFLSLIAFITIIVVGCESKKTNPEKVTVKKPNILVILCDDLGYSDVGFNGSKDIITPSLDRLAKNGTILTSAYVAHPFCGPSRTSIMTGRYAHKIGAQFNLPPNDGVIKKGIDVNEVYISNVLRDAGYYTGAIGKWHLGASEGFRPNERGFDDWYGFLAGGHEYFPEKYKKQYKKQKESGVSVIRDYVLPLTHNGVERDADEYITDALSNETIRFVNEASKKDKPFFMYLAYNAPHTPLQAKEEDMSVFKDIKDKKRRTYAGMVYAVDRGVGKIVESLKANGQYDNTLIVFFSDNGGKLSKGATNFPLREGKGSTCEGGYRVPMFIHWPNVVPSNRVYDHPVSALDLYPTFAGLAEAKIPEGKILDGKDIWKDFIAGESPRKGETLYAMRHRTGYTDVGVRRDQWKALRVSKEPWKLFNVAVDKGESHDLSVEHPEILKELAGKAKEWSKDNKQPLWFHNDPEGDEGKNWRAYNMPRFDETFDLEK